MAKHKRKKKRSHAKHEVTHHRKAKHGIPPWLKTGARVLGFGLAGALAGPLLPEALSGPAIGLGIGGLFSGRANMLPMLGIGLGVQGMHSIGRTKPFADAHAAVQQIADKAMKKPAVGETKPDEQKRVASGGSSASDIDNAVKTASTAVDTYDRIDAAVNA